VTIWALKSLNYNTFPIGSVSGLVTIIVRLLTEEEANGSLWRTSNSKSGLICTGQPCWSWSGLP